MDGIFTRASLVGEGGRRIGAKGRGGIKRPARGEGQRGGKKIVCTEKNRKISSHQGREMGFGRRLALTFLGRKGTLVSTSL